MEKIIGRKKGSLPDTLFFVIKLLVMAVAFILLGFFWTQFGSELDSSPVNNTATGGKAVDFIQDVGENRMPTYFTMLFVFDIIGIIVTSFLISLSPIFFVLYIIFAAFAVLLGVFSEVFYERLSESAILSSYVASQGMINFIMQHTMTIALIVCGISALIIMSKIPGRNSVNDL